MKYFISFTIIFFIFILFAFPDLSFGRQLGLSCIFGFFADILAHIEYKLEEIKKKLYE